MRAPFGDLRIRFSPTGLRLPAVRHDRRARHVWAVPGRAHIEVRGVHRPGMEWFIDRVEHALRAIDGVHLAELNPILARVVVLFDEDAVDIDDLVEVLDELEEDNGITPDDVPTDDPPHPGDTDALVWSGVELGADVAGIALGFGARLGRVPRLPIELATLLPALDTIPPVRHVLETRKGLEAAFVSTSALLQGFAQGPVGLAVDAAHRVTLLREAVARRRAWERVEAEFVGRAHGERLPPVPRNPRPIPMPEGPIETYARVVALGSLGAGAMALGVTRNPRKTADVLLAAIPRPARLTREACAAQIGCVFADRNIVVMDPRALRRLDRIDTVVLDAGIFPDDKAKSVLVDAVRAVAHDLVIVQSFDELVGHVEGLQREGRVVAVISARPGPALTAADCGIGVIADEGPPPWGAHVLCPTLYDAALVVDATATARNASRRAVWLASGGATAATMLAFGRTATAGRRVVLTVNATALTGIALGTHMAAGLAGRRIPPAAGDGVAWHAFGVEEAMDRLGVTSSGLDDGEVAQRRVETGRADQPASVASLFLKELSNPLTVLLGAGGVLSTVAGSLTDGLLISSVLGLNALVGTAQRAQTEKAIRRLTVAVSSRVVRVRREGQERLAAARDLVDGDVIVLRAGDVVPADARVIAAEAVEADESALTGESLPVAKCTAAVDDAAAVADRHSMVYSGTAIAAGRAEGVIVAIGDRTEAERGLTNGAAPPATGVEARLDDLTRQTVPLVLAAGGVLTGSTLLRGAPVREAVSTGVSLVAAAVPEGLPFLATVAQAAAARRLSRDGVLVRNPRVLEALGRVDVLCFDKTGTLTEGQLKLRSASDGKVVDAMPGIDGKRRSVLAAALRATPRLRGEKLPHPTDQALVEGGAALELGPKFGAHGWRKVGSLPFTPTRGYHAVLARTADGLLLSVKGAPEVVLPRCTTWRRGKKVVELDGRGRKQLARHVDALAEQGLRVLAVAERRASGGKDLDDDHITALVLFGFVTVADVTRPSAMEPIAELQHAGISVAMLTGDHPRTAEAIAAEVGLTNGGVVTGPDIDSLDDATLDELLTHATVFARVTPAHKVRIVEGYQRLGRVVAMTGDGANDAQAIRLADIGVAFGPRATSAARAAADLVIVDDRVETLIAAIIEGRAMWASVRDALALLLGGNLGEVLFTTGATLVSGRSPLNARQLLAVNLLTDLVPAMAIALQPPRARIDLRQEGPETSLGGRLTRDIAVRAAATSLAAAGAWTVARVTGTPARAGTVALAALVGAQLGQTIAIGHRSPVVIASGLASVGALVGIVQTPGVSQFFGCRPLGPVGWSIAATAATTATVGAVLTNSIIGRRAARADAHASVIDEAKGPSGPDVVVPFHDAASA